ncbi:tetratricopeptide repeat protein [candidate division KSB1 bacterium]|nr:tetratricopeptide repeat protein [candidate division KSB1 bacterium]
MGIALFFAFQVSAQQQRMDNKQMRQLERVAANYEASGKYNDALQLYQRLWDRAPDNIGYYRGVKDNLIRQKQFNEAVLTVKKMIGIRPEPFVEADLGEVYYIANQEDQAFREWNAILERQKNNPAAFQAVANVMVANRLVDEAIEVYKKGRELISSRDIFVLELANLYHSKLDYLNATEMYIEYLRYKPDRFSFVESQIGRLAKNIEEWQPIAKIIQKQIARDSENTQWRKLLASLYMQFAEYELAFQQYEYIDGHEDKSNDRKRKRWGQELFRFGQSALQDGAFEYAEKAFRLVIERYPDSAVVPDAMVGMAEATERQRKYGEAFRIYTDVVNTYPQRDQTRQAYFRIGDIQLNVLHQPDDARKTYLKILDQFSVGNDSYFARFKIAQCDIRRGDIAEAKRSYQQVILSRESSDEIKAQATFYQSLVDFWQGDFQLALKKLNTISAVNTVQDHERGLFVNDALELFMFINEHQKDSTALRSFARAELFIEQNKLDSALTKLYSLKAQSPPSSLIDVALFQIGHVEFSIGNYQKSMSAYNEIIDTFPQSIYCDMAQQAIGNVYEQGFGDIPKAIDAYEKVLINYPNSMLIEDIRRKIRELELVGS